MRVINKDILIFEPLKEEEKSAGGLILTGNKVDYSAPITAEVVDVGSKTEFVHRGDIVYYLPGTGSTIKTEKGTYRIFDESRVLAIE